MKKLLLLLFCCFHYSLGHAATRYVSDDLRITLRSGPSPQNQIIRMIDSGTKMEVFEEIETASRKYSRVKLTDGKEGWVLSQYLVNEPIARDRLVELEKQYEAVKLEYKQLKDSLKDLKSVNLNAQSSNTEMEQSLKDALGELQHLKELSANAIQIDKDNKDLSLQLSQLQNEYKIIESETQALKDSNQREWFIYGGLMALGSLLLGILLTRIRWQKRNSWGSSF